MGSAIVRERFEWSNHWWDHADDATLPRVLLVGDSLSTVYGPVVVELLAGAFHVDRLASSRGVHDPYWFAEIRTALADRRYRAIHFNNGLHATHLDDAAYAGGLRALVRLLREAGGGAALAWASTTPRTLPVEGSPPDEVNDAQVVRRNAAAAAVMAEHGIPTNDLYGLVVGRGDLRVPDGYHFTAEGYRVLGSAVARVLREACAA